MTCFKDIRAAIKAVVDEAETIQEVYTYERSTFGGFPVVVIAPSENEADYGSTNKDRMVFVFKLRIYYPIPKEGEHEAAETALEEAFDEMLTLFKTRGVLGSACDWLEPVPGSWYYEERGAGVYRVAEITIRAIKYI